MFFSLFGSVGFYGISNIVGYLMLNPVFIYILDIFIGGARGVMVIVVGNGHGDTSSNPGRD